MPIGRNLPMAHKPTYGELEERVKELEQEVAERKRMEETLEASVRKYSALIENSPDMIYVLDSEGRFSFVGGAVESLFGFTTEELIGKHFTSIIWPEDLRKAQWRFNERRTGKRSTKGFEVRLTTREGEKKHCDIKYLPIELYSFGVYDKPVSARDNKFLATYGVARDITERRLMDEALKKSSEKTRLFAYSVAHDLKNPAIGIYGLTKRLQKHCGDTLDEKAKNYCDKIFKAAQQIVSLVENIKIYISTKETPLSMQNVTLGEILDIVRDEFSSQLDVRQIRWSQPKSMPEIRVDRLSILRVLRNLVENALKHGGDELSEITIGYEGSDDFHILSVSNDGLPIKLEDPEKIFGPFQRHETSRGVEGTGLGLSIVKEIAEQHGGKVWAQCGQAKGPSFYTSISRHL
jgi:PAS domain S-box-containing protein